MGLKIYVAAAFGAKERVRALYAVLRKHGYEITFDWTSYEDTPLRIPGREVALQQYREWCALADLQGVRDANIVVVLPCEDHKGHGRFMECGGGLILNKQVIVYGQARDSVFYSLAHCRLVSDGNEVDGDDARRGYPNLLRALQDVAA